MPTRYRPPPDQPRVTLPEDKWGLVAVIVNAAILIAVAVRFLFF